MRLTLENFRCYKNQVFDIGDKGMTLISGGSGKGKSTILLGISFVLYGKGSKLIRIGEKSCSVLLEMGGMKILRTKMMKK